MDKILDIIRELVPEASVDAESLLIDDEILDSFDLVALVGDVADTFDVRIGAEDVTPENFATPAAILALVERLAEK